MRTAILIGAICAITSARAQDSGFGIGLIIGEPTGISMKGWLDGEHAIDGALAWGSLGHGGVFHLHADYLIHKMDLISVNKGKLPLYFGPGVRFHFWNSDRYWHDGKWHDGTATTVAARFPVGLAYLFDGAPVDVFFEVVPTLDLIPSTWFEVDWGIGGRYWF
jgi:hypothetical protein